MRHPAHIPGWLRLPDLVAGILPGEWTASVLLQAIAAGRFPPPQVIPGHAPLLGWSAQTVTAWIEALCPLK